jgi:hypothetical protein
VSESLDRDDLDAVVAFEIGEQTDAGFAVGGNESWQSRGVDQLAEAGNARPAPALLERGDDPGVIVAGERSNDVHECQVPAR